MSQRRRLILCRGPLDAPRMSQDTEGSDLPKKERCESFENPWEGEPACLNGRACTPVHHNHCAGVPSQHRTQARESAWSEGYSPGNTQVLRRFKQAPKVQAKTLLVPLFHTQENAASNGCPCLFKWSQRAPKMRKMCRAWRSPYSELLLDIYQNQYFLAKKRARIRL